MHRFSGGYKQAYCQHTLQNIPSLIFMNIYDNNRTIKIRTYTEKEAKQSYLPPCIELTEIVVEKGFAASEINTSTNKICEYDGIDYVGFDEF